MFDEKAILARLQNGENVQDIANEMAAVINAANKIYSDQKAEEAARKAEAEKAKVQKKNELQEILDLFVDWAGAYYGVNVDEVKSQLNADVVLGLADSMIELVDATKNLEVMIPHIPTVDETINDFLTKMGW